jgi:hypothetical protein
VLFKSSINPITNPNPVYSHTLSRDNILTLYLNRIVSYHEVTRMDRMLFKNAVSASYVIYLQTVLGHDLIWQS